jgi:curli biogenesis system outer membrane secretion channel CsgG
MKYGKKFQIIKNMLIAAMALMAAALPALAKSAQEIRAQKSAEIPVCSKSYGALSVLEPEEGHNWWTGAKLPAPSTLIKVYVRKSGCFTLVDRGAGFQAGQAERELAAGGNLRKQSNVGRGQIRAADYVMTPELASQNSNSGGNRIGGLVGGLIGGSVGALIGGLDIKKKTADVVLSVTDLRSSEMVAISEGSYKKTDIGFSAAGALWGSSGIGGTGVGGYANTEIGQVIALAYLNAYIDMIIQFSELPEDASASNETQAVEVIKPARMLANPDGSGEAVRSLDVGMLLYPTGNKMNLMWEVEDELGNKGWVNSTMFQLAR